MRSPHLAYSLVLGLLACTPTQAPNTPIRPSIPISPCALARPHSSTRVAAECGTISVPNNALAAESSGPTQLRIALVRASNPTPRPEGLFFLSGPSAEAVSEQYVDTHGALLPLRRDRDLVLLDPRGILSTPALSCAIDPPNDPEATLRVGAFASWFARCVPQLSAPIENFGVQARARDLERARSAMGYETITLYARSDAADTAIAYARLYPTRVHALVLESPMPLLPALNNPARLRAVDRLLRRCLDDAECARAFPQLAQELATLRTQTEQASASVRLRDPTTGRMETVSVSRSLLEAVSIEALETPARASLLPLWIHTAAEGDWQPLTAFLRLTSSLRVDRTHWPFLAASLCAAGHAPAGLEARCPSPTAVTTPVSVPALVFVSAMQNEVDAEALAALRAQFRTVRVLTVPADGRLLASGACVPRLMADFLREPTAATFDTSCLQTVTSPKMFVDFMGPAS